MEYQKKRDLATNASGLTLEGVPCKVGGWANDYATITADCGGFWSASWETVERIASGSKNFTADDVSLISWRWQGNGTTPLPEALKRYMDR